MTLQGKEPQIRVPQMVIPQSCPYTRYLAQRWKKRAYRERQAYQRWFEAEYVLHDFAYRPGNRAWLRAVVEVQRPFPGTASWLVSCSDAEGGHGRWVGYGGQGYSVWLRDSDTVGGNMQFRWSTFKGMFRNALEHVVDHGYKVPSHLRDPSNDITWRSALGQAMAAGWARYTGNDNSHWSASWGNGC